MEIWPKRILLGFGVAVFVLAAAGVLYHHFSHRLICPEVEIARQKSPLYKLDAVLVKGDCGSVATNKYSVRIVPAGTGETDRSDNMLETGDEIYGLEWAGDILVVKIHAFRAIDFQRKYYFDCPYYFHFNCKSVSIVLE